MSGLVRALLTGGIRAEDKGTWHPQTIPDLDRQIAMGGVMPTYTGMNISENLAMNLPPVFACVRVRAETLGQLSLHLYRRKERGAERAVNHPVYRLLHDEPNEEMTSISWRMAQQAHVDTWGNAYCWIDVARVGRNSGTIKQLYPMKPDRVRPFREGGRIKYEYKLCRDDGSIEPVTYDMSQVLHIPGMGYDGVMGYSPVQYNRQALGIGFALEQYLGNTFGRGVNIRGVFTGGQAFTSQEQLDVFRDNFLKQYAGLEKSGGMMFLFGADKYDATVLPLEDAEFLAERKYTREEIAGIWRVPAHMIGDLSRSTFCLPADAVIYAVKGPKRIVDVNAGELVWSKDDAGKWAQSRVLRSECTGEDEILTIKCRNRTLRCNARHRVAVRREKLEPYAGGRGRYITVNGQKMRKAWGVEWIEAGKLEVGDMLVGINRLPETCGESCPTREKVTPEFMEVLGLLLGDGFYARTGYNHRGSTFGFSHGENDEHVAYYTGAIEKEFRQFDGPYGRKNGGTRALVGKLRDKNTTIFYSSMAYDELEKCGLIGTARTKRVPSWVFGLTNELKLAFLRGYLDADGTAVPNGQIRFVSVNRDMLDDFRHLCMSVGIPVGNLFYSDIKSEFAGKPYHHRLHGFVCCDREANQKMGSHITMYRERMVGGADSKHKRHAPIYPNEAKMYALGDGLSATGILSIERGPSEPVYDLCVEGSHSFVTDGLLVHNSNIEFQGMEFAMYTMMPPCKSWEQAINKRLLTEPEKAEYYSEFDLKSLMRGDAKSRGEWYKLMKEVGAYNANRILESEGENTRDDPGGEKYWDSGPQGQGKNAGATTNSTTTQNQASAKALRPVFVDAAARIMKREAQDILAQADKWTKRDDMDGFSGWLGEFWGRHEQACIEILRPAYAAMGCPKRAETAAKEHVNVLKGALKLAQTDGIDAVKQCVTGRNPEDMPLFGELEEVAV